MRGKLGRLVFGAAWLSLGIGSGASALEKDGPQRRLLVKVWDPLAISPRAWAGAIAVVEGVFAETGLHLHWQTCPPGSPSDCSCPSGTHEIGLRFHRRAPDETLLSGHAAGGATLVIDREAALGIAYVFHDRVERIARDEKLPLELVLGITVAHELGHVLLPPGHSGSGIMRARLGAPEWEHARRGWLRFAAGDLPRMRARPRAQRQLRCCGDALGPPAF